MRFCTIGKCVFAKELKPVGELIRASLATDGAGYRAPINLGSYDCKSLLQLLEQWTVISGDAQFSGLEACCQRSQRPFEKGLITVARRDSSLGCGPGRAVAEWRISRSAHDATLLI